jgi:MFS family permease
MLSFFWLAFGVLVAGHLYPAYSHLSQFMSELGATGTEYGSWVNMVVFAGAEVWMMLFLFIAGRAIPRTGLALAGVTFLWLYAVLLFAAAFFPCDLECRPVEPTLAHDIHVGSGFLAYVSALCGLFLLTVNLHRSDEVGGRGNLGPVLFPVGAVLLVNIALDQAHAGLYQRLLEGLIYGWLILIGFLLSRRRRKPEARGSRQNVKLVT